MDTNQPIPFDIIKIRDHLFAAEKYHQNMGFLYSKRQEIENKIQFFQTQIDAFAGAQNPDLLNFNKKELARLRSELHSLDAYLDEWEDIDEYKLYSLREELLNAIWEAQPESFAEQKWQWKEFKTSLILEKEIKQIKQIVEYLHIILQNVIQSRESGKGIGLMRYIFGVSPNAKIERNLLLAHDYILHSEPALKQALRASAQTFLQPFFQEIYEDLEKLKNHCTAIWGFKHIDVNIAAAEKKLMKASQELQMHYHEVKTKAENMKNQLDSWLLELGS